jgi:hypothetical protein
MVSIVYSIPCGGRREFTFNCGADLADHVQANRPAMFVGVPKLGDENYADKLAALMFRPYSMPQERK